MSAPDGPDVRQQGPDVRQLSSRVVYQDRWLTLRQDEIEYRDGSRGSYAVVDKPDFAMVIPAEDGPGGGRFCLVEEFRYPLQRRAWSFPQGGFPDRGTGDPAELARLELAQETGLRATVLTPLGFLNCAHGLSGQGFHTFLATGLTQGVTEREREEQDMRQGWVTRAEFTDMIRSGAICDDATVAAYALLLLHEQAGQERTAAGH
ncbi:MAG: NUDIX hydrolase [Actinobacteria bacterium]|nr:NUDIX hydrolase [Actinomycetota bacterium]MBO0787552.1 NUDIX hydrolase [Actinomycetota bacterium]